MPKRTRSFREQLLKDLADPAEAAHYINAALDDSAEEDSQEMLLVALRDVAEAWRMSAVANEAGVSRESVYRMLSKHGNPTYRSLAGILKALDLRLSVSPISSRLRKKGIRGPKPAQNGGCSNVESIAYER